MYDCQRFFILHFIVGRNKRAHSDGHIVALDRELTADEGLQHQMKRQLLLILGLLALPLRLARPIGHNYDNKGSQWQYGSQGIQDAERLSGRPLYRTVP